MIYFVARRIWACGDSIPDLYDTGSALDNQLNQQASRELVINLAPSLLASIGCAFKLRFKDTRLARTPHYYGQFSLSLVKVSPHIFFKFNPINTVTPIIRTLSMAPFGVRINLTVLTALTVGKRCTAASQSAGVESPKALLLSSFLVAIDVVSLTETILFAIAFMNFFL